ncbi:mitochondrion protein [Rhizophagus irregularis]|uniref:Mitochondrial pyruvate carrier n=3 Tax=Rhizophagus irregularis TaxID=588596 RepID=A0A2I1GY73_9GLOM|nr:mitochondrion protein [Rhizophagus irregularis DAOM 181602=DAOM 197198]EXX77982.1 Fmp43p [Rhizophagus irregularis DAOM 197198w]PKC03098.1 mitochondrion protein [Rhizophagus irregularis]EXX77983.1 Fmp43p [Rhizophagus irregularis DAOM 197198w]PKC61048.1 mitochondrion protein [Rhizophagus irregularis]PKK64714.1 mitochondrion protein [Rhizophagus irregularis]|eukprot:XP_025175574.1 mitochondrion protein [Rhizophagus irregularis DAOM 181602=DAOM 197198]
MAANTVVSSKLQQFINHPAGPKTVHFWAPVMKWGLVIAGLSDLKRPPESLSVSQNVALTATGLIWSRYSTQIIPVNYTLLSVNLFVAGTGLTQMYRIWNYRRSLKSSPVASNEPVVTNTTSTSS